MSFDGALDSFQDMSISQTFQTHTRDIDAPYVRGASRMNLQLPPGTTRCLEKLIHQRHEDLRSLQTKTAETRKLLSHLESELVQARQDIAICTTLSHPAPIRLLPTEILSHIFLIAGSGDVYDLIQPENSMKPVCQVLIHVSKYWRDVAFQTKGIWQHRFLIHGPGQTGDSEEGPPADPDYARCMRRLLGAIEMYKEHLTDIELRNTHTISRLQPVHDIILGLRDRLVSLHLAGTPNHAYVPDLNMPQLERLFVLSSPSSRANQLPVLCNTPKLKKLFLAAPDSQFDAGSFLLPWPQINHLSIGISYSTSSFQILRQRRVTRPSALRIIEVVGKFPNLVHLHITALRQCSVIHTSTHPQVHLSRLKVLEIHDTRFGLAVTPALHTGDTEDVWDRAFPFNLSTPVLETFNLIFAGGKGHRSAYTPQFHGRMRATGAFLQRAPSLSKVRILVCPAGSDRCFGGIQAEEGDVFPSGSSGIIRFSGDRPHFKMICGMIPRDGLNGGHRFAQLGTQLRAPSQTTVQHELWMDRWIDRYVEGFKYTPVRLTTPSYSQESIKAMEAVFGLMGDHEGIAGGAERRVYLAL